MEEINRLKPDQLRGIFPIIDRDSIFLIKNTHARQVLINLFDIAAIEPFFPAKKHKDAELLKESVRVLDFRILESGLPPEVRRY